MSKVTFTPNHHGIGQMLRDPMMWNGLDPFAEAAKVRAQATAPHGRGTSARFGGKRYADSFDTEHSIGQSSKGTWRAYARVTNSHRIALWLEYGTKNFSAFRTLRKAAGISRFDAHADLR